MAAVLNSYLSGLVQLTSTLSITQGGAIVARNSEKNAAMGLCALFCTPRLGVRPEQRPNRSAEIGSRGRPRALRSADRREGAGRQDGQAAS